MSACPPVRMAKMPGWQKKRPDGKKPPHGPCPHGKKTSGWQKTSAWSRPHGKKTVRMAKNLRMVLSAWQKNRPDGKKTPHGPCPHGKKAVIHAATGLLPQSNGFPALSLLPQSLPPTPQTCTAVLHTVQHRRRLSPLADRRAKVRIKPSHQSPSLQPLPFSAASSEKSSPRCLPS